MNRSTLSGVFLFVSLCFLARPARAEPAVGFSDPIAGLQSAADHLAIGEENFGSSANDTGVTVSTSTYVNTDGTTSVFVSSSTDTSTDTSPSSSTATSTVVTASSGTATSTTSAVTASFAVTVTFKNFHQCMAKMMDLRRGAGSAENIQGSGFTAGEGIEPYCRVMFPLVSAVTASDPCKQIEQACEAAGFQAGEWENGNGLWNDCWDPIMKGAQHNTTVARSIPLPTVDPSVVTACQQEVAPVTLPTGTDTSAGTSGH